MDELEKQIEQQAHELISKPQEQSNEINKIIDDKVKVEQDVKSAIDLFATKTALEQEETITKVVKEKQEELRNDAEAKRVQAETERTAKEVEKVKQEKEKQIAELDKAISAKRKEAEQLKAESDKAQTFFESNEDILSYIGVRKKKSIGVMQALMFPATIIFIIVQILLFPFTLGGKFVETIINILGGISKAITGHALKIVVSVLVITMLIGGGFCAYYFMGKIFV